jgi:hypothetical protein
VAVLRYRELFRHLQQSEDWMRSLLTTTVDGVITIDKAGNIVDSTAPPSASRLAPGRDRRPPHQRAVSDVRQSGQHGLLHYLRTGEGDAFQSSAEIDLPAQGRRPRGRAALDGQRAPGRQDLFCAVHYGHQRTARHAGRPATANSNCAR